jgi:Cu2+-containing amine oxidase
MPDGAPHLRARAAGGAAATSGHGASIAATSIGGTAMRASTRRALFPLLAPALALVARAGAQQPAASPASPASPHPLDGLRAAEIWTTHDVLRASGRLDTATQFAMVQLREPAKQEALAWAPGRAVRREALAVLRQKGRTYEAIVDVGGRRIASWREVPGVQSHFTEAEFEDIGAAIRKHPEVRAALARRGLSDLATIRATSRRPSSRADGASRAAAAATDAACTTRGAARSRGSSRGWTSTR